MIFVSCGKEIEIEEEISPSFLENFEQAKNYGYEKTYEDWLLELDDKTKLEIKDLYFNDNGNLILKFSDDSIVDIGHYKHIFSYHSDENYHYKECSCGMFNS